MKALISGATRGIGRAIATQLAKQGFELILLARTQSDLEKTKEELSQFKVKVQLIVADLSDASAVKALSLEGKLDVLVNNLGIYAMDQASRISTEDLRQQLEINLFSAINLTEKCLPLLRENSASSIINIASVMALQSNSAATSYSISKHAFKGWNDALREELRTEGIRITAIYPGAVNTSSWDGIPANRDEMIQAEDVASLVGSVVQTSGSSLVEEIRISPRAFNG